MTRSGFGERAILAGPFFSRERAQQHYEARRYEYGKAIVYCFSGHYSQHFRDLREALEAINKARRGDVMPSDWANREVKRLKAAMFSECARSPDEFWAAALDAARAQGRREGLEEAAGIAEIGGRDDLATIIGKVIAADIRARIEEPAAQEPKA